jgi:hypothetical protein
VIKVINGVIDKTIKYLNKLNLTKDGVYIHICEGYDVIETPDGGKGFGVFVPERNEIYVATEVPEPEITIIETIAHEYYHFVQKCWNVPYDEAEAEFFAETVVMALTGGVSNE